MKTSIDWLVEKLSCYDSKMIELFSKEIQEAKEMNKQERMQSFKDGVDSIFDGESISEKDYLEKI